MFAKLLYRNMAGMFLTFICFFPSTLPAMEIQTPDNPALTEMTAARELQEHLTLITGIRPEILKEGPPKSLPVFYVGKTQKAQDASIDVSKMRQEQWELLSVDNGIVIAGGIPRGILYGTYHYLEDFCGVHWWNQNETDVPQIAVENLPLIKIKISGEPAFSDRSFYNLYCMDGGRLTSHLRFSPDGYTDLKYGKYELFGPPNSCHTFAWYIPPQEYFSKHPEWFAMDNGIRTQKQLCLSNKELRKEFVKKLKLYIKQGQATAAKGGYLQPLLYDISQNDDAAWCECPDCLAVIKREGSESGILLDFINEIADSVKDEYPDIMIATFAYLQTEKMPKHIQPAKNVMIVLCDTTSNIAKSSAEKGNTSFAELLKKWNRITNNIRVWDYGTTYRDCAGFPFPSEFTYAEDFRSFRNNGVKQLMFEMEHPVTGDARDYKIWLLSKLMENPDLDFNSLSETFAHKYYGPAGALFLKYRQMIKDACNTKISVTSNAVDFSFLNLALLEKLHGIFDEGEKLLEGKEVFLKRWKHLRLGIDRATLVLNRNLHKEFYRKNKTLNNYPFDAGKIAERIEQIWMSEANNRLAGTNWYDWEKRNFADESKKYALPSRIDTPAVFKNVRPDKLFIFEPEEAGGSKGYLNMVKDPDSNIGVCQRLSFDKSGKHSVDKYTFPMEWGVYDRTTKSGLFNGRLPENVVKGPGYHWYKLGESRLGSGAILYFPWSWHYTCNISAAYDEFNGKQKFEIWAKIKFSGPTYPYGKKTEESSISIERIAVIKKS